MIRIKRIYEEPSADDGLRVLVDRLWPRGISKARAQVDRWEKDISPTTELRHWFGHDPAKWEEFLQRVGQKVYLSATPGKYELGITDSIVEQVIRPTGLVDPQIVVKPSKGQIDDLLEQIRLRVDRDEREIGRASCRERV